MQSDSLRAFSGAVRGSWAAALGCGALLCGATSAVGQCVSGWENAATNSPGARQQPAVVYDTARARVVLFGGFDLAQRKGDTWAFDGTAWTLISLTGPAARAGHAMAYDTARDRIVMFGGFDGNSLGDTWEFDGLSWTMVGESGPPARSEHAMVYDPVRARTVLLGGEVDGDETWEWDGAGWHSMGIPGPPARFGHAMVYDLARSRVVMALGRGATGLRSGTWAYDGVAWQQIAASGPSQRFYQAMMYDAARDRVVLFGGTSTGAAGLNDTWEFDGSVWSEPAVTATPPRLGAPGVFDAARGVSLVMCGSTSAGNATGETWKWVPGSMPEFTFEPSSLTVDPGATAVFDATAMGSGPLIYRWSHDGTMLADGASALGVIFGSGTPHLEVRLVTAQAQGVYRCEVMNGCGEATSSPASLVVRTSCPADVDDGSGTGTPDGGVTVDDLLFFFAAFGAGDPRADLDDGSGAGIPDGGVTVDDMLYFLVRYNGGC